MLITRAALDAAYLGFKTVYQGAFGGVKPLWNNVAMEVKSTTSQEVYPWMGAMPSIREWVGDRVVQNLKNHDFSIKNKNYELTVGVPRDKFEDDQLGVFTPMFSELGRSVAAFPDKLVFDALKAGLTTLCYDGQNFLDTDHPVINPDGSVASVANYIAGAGNPWYLMDLTRAVKPLVFQNRRTFDLVRKDRPEDDNVFNRAEYIYGVDGRCNVGVGLWQLVFMSKAELTHANYATARAAMQAFKADGGDLLGVTASHLVVGGTNEGAGRAITMGENKPNGETNEWKGTAQLLYAPQLP